MGELAIGKTKALGATEVGNSKRRRQCGEALLLFHDEADVLKEPTIDRGKLVNLLHSETGEEGVAQKKNPLGARSAEFLTDRFDVGLDILAVRSIAEAADLQRAERFLERLLECASNGHGLAHALHLSGEGRIGRRELLKSETRNLGHDIIDRRLEAGGRDAGDVILQLIQRVSNSELGGDFGNRKSCRLRGQCRTARDARIHFNHDHAAVGRVDGELDVRPAGFNANCSDDREAGIAHRLIFLVGERLDRCHRNRVAGVHAHGIEVLDRANDHTVVSTVAHDFHLEFLPTKQRFLHQHFANG